MIIQKVWRNNFCGAPVSGYWKLQRKAIICYLGPKDVHEDVLLIWDPDSYLIAEKKKEVGGRYFWQ